MQPNYSEFNITWIKKPPSRDGGRFWFVLLEDRTKGLWSADASYSDDIIYRVCIVNCYVTISRRLKWDI